MNAIDTTTAPGRELAGILREQARRAALVKGQAADGVIRLPSMGSVRRGMARQTRLDDLRAADLEPLAVGR
jgi:hypothetical protein